MEIAFQYTQVDDLDYVIDAENHIENSPFIGSWSKEAHFSAIMDKTITHFIIRHQMTGENIGYMILAGTDQAHHAVELKRLVITSKNRGYGRQAIRLIKSMAFDEWGANRLWLDVLACNNRAKKLYVSEGFVEEGLLRQHFWKDDHYESAYVMSILREEFDQINN